MWFWDSEPQQIVRLDGFIGRGLITNATIFSTNNCYKEVISLKRHHNMISPELAKEDADKFIKELFNFKY